MECRSQDLDLVRELSTLNDPMTQLCTASERAVLVGIGATCATAIGAFATFSNGALTLTAELSDPLLNEHFRVVMQTDDVNLLDIENAAQLGMAVAEQLRSTPLGTRLSGKNE